MPIEWGKVFDGIQRSIEPRGYSIGLRHDNRALSCWFGEGGYPVAFIGQELDLPAENLSAKKVAAKRLRALCEAHNEARAASLAG